MFAYLWKIAVGLRVGFTISRLVQKYQFLFKYSENFCMHQTFVVSVKDGPQNDASSKRARSAIKVPARPLPVEQTESSTKIMGTRNIHYQVNTLRSGGKQGIDQ